ncbi:acyltransferase [Rhodococcus sp. Leaf7]|uniref:apolipoprotein N-acyltransferase n=1 Tax=unclassified Rhodococcus (in: high G+C Gram-positive bacteria) TaxID=192944 RepID=UPI0006FA2758|nr:MULTISPECIES: apolipoprotein N-acyltransferase [unclassified Rhodococcus (in: high G+C Gram-positive bacteria)]KQU03356.1 acyltransferase [Rhodococcus sp. Leaf7]KQU39056.1 acyltransferase [Rhodococcus sp. Leaf247]
MIALARLLLSAGAGALLFASFPPRPLWFLAPVALALIGYVLTEKDVSKKGGFLYGLAFGLGFFLPLLPWIGVYVGPLPWIALATAESLFLGLFGVAGVVVSRLPFAAVWLTAVFSAVEWLRSTVPFGGFPWGRLAFGQSESVLLPLASVGGAPLLSAAVALVGMCLALAWRAARSRSTLAVLGLVVLAAVGPVVALALRPGLAGPQDGDSTITIAAIQGSVPRLGLDFNAQRRQVLENHVKETVRLAEDVDAGRAPKPDVVIWPENASDVDPTRDSTAAADITAASVRIGAPILVGAVLANADGTSTNTVIAWDGTAGPGERHDKKIVQPFGEYLPYRSFFRLFSSYADSAGNFVPGDGDGVVHVAAGAGRDEIALAVGVATCYEVAFDRAPTEAVRAGAQILAVPTNNATFGDTEMTYQQLAMSRVRAVEHSRSVIVAATSGVSAIIAPNGSVTSRTELFDASYLVSTVGLRTETTLATRLGPIPEWILVALGAVGVIGATVINRRHRTVRSAQSS